MSVGFNWFKSSYSTDEGECLEVALTWTKSTYSGSEGECLEVAATPTTIHIRDSKLNPAGPTLRISPGTWTAFLSAPARPARGRTSAG
ncbi:DUF397 domain-containing protein [Streptomyces sp. NPDC015345]|uniref:DUF397 domain-containing protein n=1 Tax=Streptomyces sp. NPDC015345 TaxID=3364953 RepID=UPI0036FD769B